MTTKKELLYSVAYMRSVKLNKRGRPIWDIETSYLHAVDQTEASFKFRAGNTQELVNNENYQAYRGRFVKLPMRRVIAVAPVVFILEDQDTGERNVDLSV